MSAAQQAKLRRDRLERLIKARDQLAAALADDPPAHALPNIAREYRFYLDAIAASDDPQQKADAVDQLAARRKAKTTARTRRTS